METKLQRQELAETKQTHIYLGIRFMFSLFKEMKSSVRYCREWETKK